MTATTKKRGALRHNKKPSPFLSHTLTQPPAKKTALLTVFLKHIRKARLRRERVERRGGGGGGGGG